MRAEKIKSEDTLALILQRDNIPRACSPHGINSLGQAGVLVEVQSSQSALLFVATPQAQAFTSVLKLDAQYWKKTMCHWLSSANPTKGQLHGLQVENDLEVWLGLRRSEARLITTSVVVSAQEKGDVCAASCCACLPL